MRQQQTDLAHRDHHLTSYCPALHSAFLEVSLCAALMSLASHGLPARCKVKSHLSRMAQPFAGFIATLHVSADVLYADQ